MLADHIQIVKRTTMRNQNRRSFLSNVYFVFDIDVDHAFAGPRSAIGRAPDS